MTPRRTLSIWMTLVLLLSWRGWAKCRLIAGRAVRIRRLPLTLLVGFLTAMWLLRGLAATLAREGTERQQVLEWFACAMVMYTFWQMLRMAWTRSDRQTFYNYCEKVILAAAPIRRWERVAFRVSRSVLPTAGKASLVCIPLLPDVRSISCAWLALFLAFASLDFVRLATLRLITAASSTVIRGLRGATAAVAAGLLVYFATHIVHALNDPEIQLENTNLALLFLDSLADLSASPIVVLAAAPWQPFGQLLTASWREPQTFVMLAIASSEVLLLLAAVFWVDAKTTSWKLERERSTLTCYRDRGEPALHDKTTLSFSARKIHLPGIPSCAGIGVIVARQWISIREYLTTVILVLSLPAVLSLLPLLVTPQSAPLYPAVIGSLLFYTFLLVPPALKIDFRRDIERLDILRALPLPGRHLVAGQLLVPVFVAWLFQMLVLAIATWARPAEWSANMTGLLFLLPLTWLIFGLENCLILWFPHRQHQEGIEMFVRTTLTFIGKSLLFIAGVIVLRYWVLGCSTWLPRPWVTPAVLTSSFIAIAGTAWLTIELATIALNRFHSPSDLVAR